MIVRCWGARGSIAVSGPEYVRYGGDTTCIEIRTKNDAVVIIDAGTGIRRLGNALIREGRSEYTMIFTHAHWDHILGFPFFKPVHSDKAVIDVYGCPMEQGNMQTLLAKTMAPPHFPIPFDEVLADVRYNNNCALDARMRIDSLEVSWIPLSHPNLGLGFKFVEDGKSFVFITDNELLHRHRGGRSFDDYVAFAKGADLLFHDAEYTDEDYKRTKGWGHSTYKQALDLALAAEVKGFGLFHHNQDRTDDDLDRIVADCRKITAERGARMECFALTQHTELLL